MKKITILLPAYNEEPSFPLIKESMEKVLRDNPIYEWEFLFINDGSTDNTLQQIIRLRNEDSHYSYIDLSRNYGKEIAMMAGFDNVSSDAVIIMDADMQHPVDVIPEMIKWWEQGYDDIYAERANSNETWFKKKSSQWYYKLLQSLTRVPIQKNTGDFRLLDRSCIEALKQMRETERNTKGMYSWIGFHKKGIKYKQKEREKGKTKWSIWGLINLALNGIMSYTIAPLRIVSVIGTFVSLIAFTYLMYILVTTLIYGDPVAGYPSIMVTILFLGGIQLLGIGIVGEYLGRVFNEVKRRPGYFINKIDQGTSHTKEDKNEKANNTAKF